MIERLRGQQNSSDAVVARAARLLSAASPLNVTDSMRRRVLASVLRDRAPSRLGWRWLARPAVATALLFGTTAAAAALNREWISAAYHAVVEPTSNVPAPIAPRRAAESPPKSRVQHPTLELDPKPTLPSLAPEVERTEAPPRHALGVRAPTSIPADAGATLVLSAISRLRRERDPVAAGQALAEYLRKYPRGALREEALALSIEAAMARGDARTSERFAQLYQRSHPNGRFSALSRSALGSSDARLVPRP